MLPSLGNTSGTATAAAITVDSSCVPVVEKRGCSAICKQQREKLILPTGYCLGGGFLFLYIISIKIMAMQNTALETLYRSLSVLQFI